MKLRLSLLGGVYGQVNLDEIDTDDENIRCPDHLKSLVESPEFWAGVAEKSRTSDIHPQPEQTESEIYTLSMTDREGTTSQLAFSKSAVDNDSGLKELVSFVWAVAKPAGSC